MISLMLKLKLSSLRIGGKKSDKELRQTELITEFYKPREDVIKFYNEYFKMVNKAAYDAQHGKGPKILTPQQTFQRLTLAQGKADSSSENLVNEIRPIT